jgi:hypothetical protein
LVEYWTVIDKRLRDLPRDELVPVHGDAHFGNLIASSRGWLWLDFEDVSLGCSAKVMRTLSWRADDSRMACLHSKGFSLQLDADSDASNPIDTQPREDPRAV